MKIFAVISLFFVFLSCSKGYGYQIEKGNTIVFYTNKNEKPLAKKVADYWIENQINGQAKQFIRILKQTKCYHLQLIVKDEFKKSTLTFEEIKLFSELENELNKFVFTSIPCRIVICDGNFKELYSPISE